MRDYYKQLYANKMNNLEEMDKFLEKHNLLRLNQEEINNMNRPITSTKIDILMTKSSNKQKPRTRWLHSRILSDIYRRTNTILLKLFQNITEEGTLPNSLYEATIILIPKPDKDVTKKENYRPISLMNMDAKILNKVLANRIQQHIKRIIQHD